MDSECSKLPCSYIDYYLMSDKWVNEWERLSLSWDDIEAGTAKLKTYAQRCMPISLAGFVLTIIWLIIQALTWWNSKTGFNILS